MLKLIKNADVYAPDHLGLRDILISGNQIVGLAKTIDWKTSGINVDVYDAKGNKVIPGLIDAHVHICGGGGEGGFKTRTPELMLSNMIRAGVTTVVGCLGTDGTTRSVENLVAKAKGLKEEGVSAYCYTGSYSLPLTTVTGDIRKDIMMIDEIIGLGEIAISDHRSSAPTTSELAKVVSEGRLGGILSGKAGLVNMHIGDGKSMLDPIYRIMEASDIPITQFLPTHVNRNADLFNEGIRYGLRGGYVDLTTSTTPQFIAQGEVPAAMGLKILLEKGVEVSQITMTSDGQGSLPAFDDKGQFAGLKVGTLDSLFQAVKTAVHAHDVAFETAIQAITSSPASILGLTQKGHIKTSKDADLVVLNENDDIASVMARGEWMMLENKLKVRGTFE